MKTKKYKMNRITKFNTHNFFNPNLLLRGNKDHQPILKTKRSTRFLFYVFAF